MLHVPPNYFARQLEMLRRPAVLLRLAAFCLAGVLMWLATGAGVPLPPYRTGDVPPRKIIARADFQIEDVAETAKKRQEARRTAEAVYENNARLLEEVRQELTNKVGQLVQAETLDKVDPKLWSEFSPPGMSRTEEEEKSRFESLKTYFTAGKDRNRFDEAVKRAVGPLEKNGLLKELKHKPDQGSQLSIRVYPVGNPKITHSAEVDSILLHKATVVLRQRLDGEFKVQGSMLENAGIVAAEISDIACTSIPRSAI